MCQSSSMGRCAIGLLDTELFAVVLRFRVIRGSVAVAVPETPALTLFPTNAVSLRSRPRCCPDPSPRSRQIMNANTTVVTSPAIRRDGTSTLTEVPIVEASTMPDLSRRRRRLSRGSAPVSSRSRPLRGEADTHRALRAYFLGGVARSLRHSRREVAQRQAGP